MDLSAFLSQHILLILSILVSLVRLSEQRSFADFGLLPSRRDFRLDAFEVRRRRDVTPTIEESATTVVYEEPVAYLDDEEFCPIYQNEPLHAIMDKVCEMCHEMFSHKENSLRAECRKNCFRNEKFKSCIEIFSPQHGRQRRSTPLRIPPSL